MKTCLDCFEPKPLAEYYQYEKSNYGYVYPYCKPCWTKRTGSRRTRKQFRQESALRKFKLTAQQYDEMFSNQDGLCAICKCEMRIPCLDHDTITNKPRGFLCQQCNSAIGLMKENPEWLRNAASYLERKNGNN